MKTLTIRKHFGRLGNNMVYVICGIDFCIENNIDQIVFSDPMPGNTHQIGLLINDNKITISDDNSGGVDDISKWGHSFYTGTVPFYKRKEIVQKYILPKLRFSPVVLGNNDLVIHLRGGDIFCRPHFAYVQPPLSFYEQVITSRDWDRIYLLSEDNRNYCYDVLRLKYNCISCLDNKERHGGNLWGFSDDLALMIGATNFVCSKSSLSPLIVQLSKTIKNVYLCDFFIDVPNNRQQPPNERFERGENEIWWSKDFIGRSTDFEYKGVNYYVYDYSDYITKFNKNDYFLTRERILNN